MQLISELSLVVVHQSVVDHSNVCGADALILRSKALEKDTSSTVRDHKLTTVDDWIKNHERLDVNTQ